MADTRRVAACVRAMGGHRRRLSGIAGGNGLDITRETLGALSREARALASASAALERSAGADAEGRWIAGVLKPVRAGERPFRALLEAATAALAALETEEEAGRPPRLDQLIAEARTRRRLVREAERRAATLRKAETALRARP